MSAKKRFTVKGCIGKIFYSPKEWEVDRETAFYYRIVNRNTGKKKWLRKEYFYAEATDYPHRPCISIRAPARGATTDWRQSG